MKRTAETTLDLRRRNVERASLVGRVSNIELELKGQAKDHALELKHLRERLHSLEAESAARGLSRMRFPSTFKRDHLPEQFDVTFKDLEPIRARNREAHDPNPVANSDLYIQRRRYDDEVFSALYGLSPPNLGSFSSTRAT